jgi:two-component system CheB/CheR fusion protein
MTGDGQPSATPEGDDKERGFPTIGIGTSAGGVRALQEFFGSVSDTLEAAFVVIVHLDPAHQSELASILATRTQMPVTQVGGRVQLEPRHVYVIPPNRQLLIADQHLSTAEFVEPRWQRAPIDLFFRSLAARRNNDFAIVMSGAGSDGAIGIKAIKEAGGIILVQDPEEAEYGSMPRSAVATGLADFVLPVREIAARLPELIRGRNKAALEPLADSDEETLQRILSHLRVRTGHDFSRYKSSTLRRRIARRMQVQRAATLHDYLANLRENAEEAQALFADLLISVTTFFRDAAAFKKLAELYIPRLFEEKSGADSIRAWVAGCATGEEAYSVAMLLLEEAARHDFPREVQVFATDIDGAALSVAREGRYPLAIEADLTDERLQRFFTRESDHYRVRRELRDTVLFARHSLSKDPPFLRLDLVSCRNLLIYFDRELQAQACTTFHLGLRPGGVLFLGSAENADCPAGLFRPLDREARIFERLPSPTGVGARVVQKFASAGAVLQRPPSRFAASTRSPTEAMMHREALEDAAPPSVVVDESYRVIHLSESAGRYLQPSAGSLSNDVTKLAREELRYDLRAALHRAFSRGEPSLSAPIGVGFNGSRRRVYLQVKPLTTDPHASKTALVFFFEGETLKETGDAAIVEERAPDELIRELKQELQFTQQHLRTSSEEYEGANEELRAANEELLSINEEYRSTAEELETSKEELQSINEELQTVNSELKAKLESVSRAHNDILNLMVATDVGILFLDTQLSIKRFTPRVAELFNIAPGDEGRSITDFTHSLDYADLRKDAQVVLRDLSSSEREVRSTRGDWYLMRLRPYRTLENTIDGVVLTFVDITERRRAEDALRDSEALIRAVMDGAADAIVAIDQAGVIRWLNKATTKFFGYSAEELSGANVRMLMPEPYQSHHNDYIENYLRTREAKIVGIGREVQARRKDGALFPAELMVFEVRHGDQRLFIGFVRDLSERRKFEDRLDKLHQNRLSSMSEMATALAHEVNQPLAAASSYLEVARRLVKPPAQGGSEEASVSLDKAADQLIRAGQIIGNLREFIARREPDKAQQSLHDLIRKAQELTAAGVEKAKVKFVLQLDASEDVVIADRIQIQQVLVNLIRNAIEAMHDSSDRTLTISTRLDDGSILTDVVDTGCGIHPPVEQVLFEAFTTTRPEGLGVGLSISRSIIEAHHGKIWADNVAEGGAKFSFTLPLASKQSVED